MSHAISLPDTQHGKSQAHVHMHTHKHPSRAVDNGLQTLRHGPNFKQYVQREKNGINTS